MISGELAIECPSPDKIRAFRERVGITQGQAAALVNLGQPARWCDYEAGRKPCDPIRWLVFLLMTDQHPTHRLTERGSHG